MISGDGSRRRPEKYYIVFFTLALEVCQPLSTQNQLAANRME